MKKMIIFFLFGMMFFTGSTYANEMNPGSSAPTAVWIKLLINFHRPKFDCESGFGICLGLTWGIEEPNRSYNRSLCSVKGQFNDQNQLVLEVEETALAKFEDGTSLPYFKGKTSITILDPYTFPEATCKALGSARPLTIKPGTYPLSYRNRVYTIVFQL